MWAVAPGLRFLAGCLSTKAAPASEQASLVGPFSDRPGPQGEQHRQCERIQSGPSLRLGAERAASSKAGPLPASPLPAARRIRACNPVKVRRPLGRRSQCRSCGPPCRLLYDEALRLRNRPAPSVAAATLAERRQTAGKRLTLRGGGPGSASSESLVLRLGGRDRRPSNLEANPSLRENHPVADAQRPKRGKRRPREDQMASSDERSASR